MKKIYFKIQSSKSDDLWPKKRCRPSYLWSKLDMKGCSSVIWCPLYSCQHSKAFTHKPFIIIDSITDFSFIVFFGNITFIASSGPESNHGEHSKSEWSRIIDSLSFDEFIFGNLILIKRLCISSFLLWLELQMKIEGYFHSLYNSKSTKLAPFQCGENAKFFPLPLISGRYP